MATTRARASQRAHDDASGTSGATSRATAARPVGSRAERERSVAPALGAVLLVHLVVVAALAAVQPIASTVRRTPVITVERMEPRPLPAIATTTPVPPSPPPVRRPESRPRPVAPPPSASPTPVIATPTTDDASVSAVSPAPPLPAIAAPTPASPRGSAAVPAPAPVPAPSTTPAPAPVTPPRFDAAYLDNPAPLYPPLSRRQGDQGRVMLRVHVDVAGRAERVELSESSGHERLDRAALDVVRRWRFVPARAGDSAVAAWVQVPIVFSLER